jgi:type VI secretion system secreted protein Hcp
VADDKTWAGLPRKTLKIALPTVAALGAGGAIAVAAIPSADGTIHACYATGTDTTGASGRLRVIDESNECQGGENAISWNQQGTPGPQGPKGDQGNKGDQGSAGTTTTPQQVGQAFLNFNGIPGGTTDPAHKGQIDVRSFSWGISNTSSSSNNGAGSGAGKAKFANLRFTKLHDKSSPVLFKAVGTGKHFANATFSVVNNGQEVIRYKLSDVTVKNFSTSDGFFAETESITLQMAKVDVSFHDGGAVLTQTWDVKNNKKPVFNSFSFKPSR